MFCAKCGNEIDDDECFCVKCGTQRKDGTKSNISKSDNIVFNKYEHNEIDNKLFKNEEKSSSQHSLKSVILLIIIVITFFTLYMPPSDSITDVDKSEYYTETTSPDTYEQTQEQKNVQICEQIASDYYATHTYTSDDVFDCDNMAQDIWNMLKTQGINAEIIIGNVEISEPITLEDCNHAWILAEVSPDVWMAIEGTGGYLVYDNEGYYKGFTFKDPKNYNEFLRVYGDYEYQYEGYENYRLYYNELVDKYNNADYYSQLTMKSGLDVARNTLEEKERIYIQTKTHLDTLLEYG
ncbi:MAG: hypothetical protein GQ533_11870 [Methanosarcinaceae archaeon]|nr:hypothetical protein [Methanosarcinaceae archaeon]